MLLLDKNDLDNLWHSDIKRTDCFIKKKEKERVNIRQGERRRESLYNNTQISADDKVF